MTATIPAIGMNEAVARLTSFQERLQEAEKRGQNEYYRLFTASPVGIGAHEIDVAKRYFRVNAQELRLLGYAESEMVGRAASDFILMQDFSQQAMDRKLSGGPLRPFVRAFRRKDGTSVMMVLLDRHLKDAQGKIAGICTVMMEIDPATANGPR